MSMGVGLQPDVSFTERLIVLKRESAPEGRQSVAPGGSPGFGVYVE
jgi:hypothetical protein